MFEDSDLFNVFEDGGGSSSTKTDQEQRGDSSESTLQENESR